jgi:hypothetical protein
METRPQEQLIELMEESWITSFDIISACMKYMSVDQVKEMMELNEFDAVWKDYEEWTNDE